MVDKIERARILWRSRRGLLELDLFLIPFADHCYSKLSASDRAAYRQMLLVDDVDLIDWLKRVSEPETLEFKRVVEQIIHHAETHSTET